VLAALALAACGGGQRSTLPPAPGKGDAVALTNLRQHPEVYADATVSTVGVVTAVRIGRMHLFALTGGRRGAQVTLEPTHAFRRWVGRRVRVSGIFTATFTIGYELLASHVSAADR